MGDQALELGQARTWLRATDLSPVWSEVGTRNQQPVRQATSMQSADSEDVNWCQQAFYRHANYRFFRRRAGIAVRAPR
jgi:hypothetical protein